MSFTNIKTKSQGFTIVELLIVVVVIAILAAITIVSYNGITRSANASSAKSTAASVVKKLEAYNAEQGRYPVTANELTGDTSKSYYITAGAASNSNILAATTTPFAFSLAGLDAGNGKTTTIVRRCGSGLTASSTQANISTTNIVGAQVLIWDYEGTGASAGSLPTSVGQTSGTGVFCPAS